MAGERKRKSPEEEAVRFQLHPPDKESEEARIEMFWELVKSVRDLRRKERPTPKATVWRMAFEWEDFGGKPTARKMKDDDISKEKGELDGSGLDLRLRL